MNTHDNSIPLEAMNCRTLEVIKFSSYSAAKMEGFDVRAIRECVRGIRNTHGGFVWRVANGLPPKSGLYLVRYRWYNRMNKRTFDEWIICQWNGLTWLLFSGAEVIEWKNI